MSKFSSFRNKMKVEHCCDLRLDASFITEGTFATEILHVRLNEVKKAGFIINNSDALVDYKTLIPCAVAPKSGV